MPLIQWGEKFSVNVAEIDREHKKLVGMINDLNEAMRQGKSKDALGVIIDGLASYAKTHFKTEEKYFDRFQYPFAVSHKKEHAGFMEKVGEFKKDFDEGRLALSVEVMHFLSHWLQAHIDGADKKYGPFFNERGLK